MGIVGDGDEVCTPRGGSSQESAVPDRGHKLGTVTENSSSTRRVG